MTRDATEILEPFRKYLKVLAELHLDRKLRGKLDPSDVVQQTMLRAYSALAEVRDARPEVLVAWLRRILARTLADAVKHYERDKRDVALERSLEADLDRSASGFAAWLAADQTSPSGRAERNEELLRMVEALAELPELMREVVVLKHCQGWTLPQIAERIGRSVPSVASLLRRGLEELRNRLKDQGVTRDDAERPHDVARLARRGHRRLHAGRRGRRGPQPPGAARPAPRARRRAPRLLRRPRPHGPRRLALCGWPTDWTRPARPRRTATPRCRPSATSATTSCWRRSPAAGWGSSTRPGRCRSTGSSRSR